MIVDNLKTDYIQKGTGKFIFILHGWGYEGNVFKNTIDFLSQKYCVVALNLPGFGKTDAPNSVWNSDYYVDFFIDFINKFAPKEVILMGHAFGGRIVLKTATRTHLPFAIQKIILIDPTGMRKESKPNKIIQLFVTFFNKKPALTQKPEPNYAPKKTTIPLMTQILAKVINEDITDILPHIKTPTLLIWGKHDSVSPIYKADEMHKAIKHSKLAIINGGHYCFLDSPQEFKKALISFLTIGETL